MSGDADIRQIVLGEGALTRIQLHEIEINGHVEYTIDKGYMVFVANAAEQCPALLAMDLITSMVFTGLEAMYQTVKSDY